MKKPREEFSLCYSCKNQKVYAVGGCETLQHKMVTIIESYNLKTQKWQVEGELINTRINPIVIAIDTKLFIMGGNSSNFKSVRGSPLDTVEIFDTKAKICQVLDFRFPFNVSNVMNIFPIGRSHFIIFADHDKSVSSTLFTIIDDRELSIEAKLQLFNYKDDLDVVNWEME